MQLVHMDVSLPATNTRQLVGPFSSGLNAIHGAQGTGKSRLVRWLRQVTAESYGPDYVPGTQSKVDLVGELELNNHGTTLRLTRDAYGRVSAKPSAVSDYRSTVSTAHHNLSARQRQAIALLADVHELADTEVALDDVARRLGLESRIDEARIGERDLLVSRERDLLSQLDLLNRLPKGREELVARRRDVEFKLEGMRQQWDRNGSVGQLDRHRLLDRFSAIEVDLHGAEAQIQQIDREIAKAKTELKHSEIGQQSVDIEPSFRQQLQQLEDRLNRWRKTLRDLKSHRETIEQEETEAQLDQQVGTQLTGALHADPRAPMRSLEAQLHHARKQLDQLMVQYWPTTPNAAPVASTALDPRSIDPRINPTVGSAGYQVQRDAFGRTHISYELAPTVPSYDAAALPEMLRSMQRDLHDICHQLSRQEAATTASALKQQALQLRRSETELLQSVEKLIEERGVLLRKIADRYNLTTEQISLTFGDWCQCNDHPHLYDWLLQEEAPRKATREVDSELRSRLEENLARLNSQRREAALRAEECRRQLRHANRLRVTSHAQPLVDNRQSEEAELLRELDQLTRQLADLDSRDRLVTELDDVRRSLSRTPVYVANSSEYRSTVDRNVIGLSGSLYSRTPLVHSQFGTSRHYDTVNGVVTEQPAYRQQYEVPSAIVRIAQRLAIGQMLANRGDAIPVVLDQPLDGLDARLQLAAVSHLALASQRIQVVLLTDDSHVADLVRQHRGNVLRLHATPIVQQDRDINRQLTGYANDEESSKWYHPTVDPIPPVAHRDFYLSEDSAIEQHPAIDREVGSRCRSHGIARIGDLLDADSNWLADCLRLSNVDSARIENWQAAADLLCSVRNLRPFDARVLLGAGIRSAAQLSAMNPNQLVDNVERFLATEPGRKILRTGNSFEHSRIRNWISAARASANGYSRAGHNPRNGYDREFGNREHNRAYGSNGSADHELEPRETRRALAERPGRAERTARPQRAERTDRAFPIVDHGRNRSGEPVHSRNGNHSDRTSTRDGRSSSAASNAKFYLELASPVMDAPSIGDRMAERLNAVGIMTVEQLIAANAESLANKLNNRKVNGETVRAWQHQASLVCRIPFLRGHDAQVLVACGITSPESLRGLSAESVLSKVSVYSKSADGQRVLRGNKEPDLAEVHDWISWSNQSRALNAA